MKNMSTGLFILLFFLTACKTMPDNNNGGGGDGGLQEGGKPQGFSTVADFSPNSIPKDSNGKANVKNFGAILNLINENAKGGGAKKIYLEPGVYEIEAGKNLFGGIDGSVNNLTGLNNVAGTAVSGVKLIEGLILAGDSKEPTIIKSSQPVAAYIILDSPQGLHISNIIFENVHVYIRGLNDNSQQARDIVLAGNIFYGTKVQGGASAADTVTTVSDGGFNGGSGAISTATGANARPEPTSAQLSLYNAGTLTSVPVYKNIKVEQNIFLMNSGYKTSYPTGTYKGKAISFAAVYDSSIISNIFGMDTGQLGAFKGRYASNPLLSSVLGRLGKLSLPDTKQYYYGVGINENNHGAGGLSSNVTIAGNYFQGLGTDAAGAELDAGKVIDQGIRLLSPIDFKIAGNYFKGWDVANTRGAILLRDAKNTLIANNYLEDAHIRVEKTASATANRWLAAIDNVWIKGNKLDVDGTRAGTTASPTDIGISINGAAFIPTDTFAVVNNIFSKKVYTGAKAATIISSTGGTAMFKNNTYEDDSTLIVPDSGSLSSIPDTPYTLPSKF